MTTAIIGLGTIGRALARHLADGGERLILATRVADQATSYAGELGANARAASVADAIADADTIIFTVWFDTMKALITTYQEQLRGKVVIDPSNPITAGEGGRFVRTLPDGVSSGSVIAGLLPDGAHYVKAFGSLAGTALADSARRRPEPAVLFYAGDDPLAAKTAERLISAAGFEPIKAGGVDAALRIEVFGDLHQFGGLDGQVPDRRLAEAALKAKA